MLRGGIKFLVSFMMMVSVIGCNSARKETFTAGYFVEQKDIPYSDLELLEDGSCQFSISYYEGICTTQGTYSVEGDTLTLHLTSSEPDGFLGEKYDENGFEAKVAIKQIFTIVDKDTIRIRDRVYSTLKDTAYVRLDKYK